MDSGHLHSDGLATERDRGLRRLFGLTRGLGVASLGLVGLLAGYIVQSKPGHSTGKAVAAAAVIPPPGPVPTLDTGSGDASALSPPAQPPLPASVPSPVVSGGS